MSAKRRSAARQSAAVKPEPKKPVVISADMAAKAGIKTRRTNAGVQPQALFLPAEHPKSVMPSSPMAMDDALSETATWAQSSLSSYAAMPYGGWAPFLGYAVLAQLAQVPEYRRISETIARHMTRKWIKIQARGEDDKSKEIAQLEDALRRFKVREAFQKAAEVDGLFGRGHIFVDLGDSEPAELKTPIGYGADAASKAKIKKGGIKRIATVEAIWCYPQGYNTNNPLDPDWYRPRSWLVQGKEVHSTRLLTFVGREVPDILKPAYSFGGLSLSQMAKPSIDNWLRTRQGVADIVNSFTVFNLATNLTEQISVNTGQALFDRADFFSNMRDNHGLLLTDKDREDFRNVSAPLGTLDAIQAQALEQIATISGIPLVFYTGNQPAGLNASSDGEIRAFYDWIHSTQEKFFRPNLTTLLDMIQLNEFGAVDPDITFEFESLWGLDEKELTEIRKVEAETDAVYVEAGIVSVEEARTRIANDPDTAYPGLDIDDIPVPPAEADGEEPSLTDTDELTKLGSDAAPRTLYVSRKVLNGKDILKWAKSQGFKDLLPADDLHVTVIYSRNPVDWMQFGEAWTSAELKIGVGGPRVVEEFGVGAKVLGFASSELTWRHRDMVAGGASWDWPTYQPHITFSYEDYLGLEHVEPYQGEIVLGPEIFEEIREDA